MKRNIIFIVNILILILVVSLFVSQSKTVEKSDNKIYVVTTIFPNYDFIKQIGKEKVDVKLLLKPGVESHTFEPTPKDIIDIQNCDMFVYTGSEFEAWAGNILESVESNIKIIDTSSNINLINKKEFEEHHANSEIIKENEEHHNHHVESSYDSHIWLNPDNAIIMIDDICAGLCNIDPENADYYVKNSNDYKSKIQKLSNSFEEIIKNSKKNEIAFAGEFSYSYFVDRYDLNFVSVYNNCGEGEDPSIAKVKSVIDYINKHNLPVVFYEELSEGTVAKMIGNETKTESLVFYTIHNGDLLKDSYVSLMNMNLKNLEKALN